MTATETYQQLQSSFVNSLSVPPPKRLPTARISATPSTVAENLNSLLKALPYYGERSFQQKHRRTLAYLLAANMVNSPISPQPDHSSNGLGYRNLSSYSYTGAFSGYQQAFFADVPEDSATSAVATLVSTVNSALNNSWWGNYAVPVLTDAINKNVNGLDLNTYALSSGSQGLAGYNNAFITVLTPTMAAVAMASDGFTPTAAALATLKGAKQCDAALALIRQQIQGSNFCTTINAALSSDGQPETAAEWILLWLWITQYLLGATPSSVSTFIQNLPSSFQIPSEVNHTNWWNPACGGTGPGALWSRLSGSDLASIAMDTIVATMPQNVTQYSFSSGCQSGDPSEQSANVKSGYSWSFTKWGAQAKYQ